MLLLERFLISRAGIYICIYIDIDIDILRSDVVLISMEACNFGFGLCLVSNCI